MTASPHQRCASSYKFRSRCQREQIANDSNRLLGWSQINTTQRLNTRGQPVTSSTSTQINYGLDAAGNLTSDGLRTFSFDASNRLAQVRIGQVQVGDDDEASKVTYLHNAAGQRVFKSEPQVAQTAPSEAQLGTDFITWLKKNFGWLFAQAQQNATLGQSYVYGDGPLNSYNLLGEYGNGGSKSAGRLEYIYLPTEAGTAQLIGLYKNNRFYAVHTDHLGTPRQITDDTNKVVWQWAYSAFGDNKPTGILKATTNPKAAITNQPTLLTATSPTITMNLRFPGQYWDDEAKLSYNIYRSYRPMMGDYPQMDPIGLAGGWNRRGYVGANPLGAIDPLGLGPWDKLYGLPKEFWKWLHKEDGGELMKAYKDPKTGQIPKEEARELYEQWKKNRENGFVDPSLLEGLLPWGLTPSELAPGTLWGPGTPYPTPEDYNKAKATPICR